MRELSTEEVAFTACWRRDAPRVAGYARRHAPQARVEDIVAETFAVAWRRWRDVPDPPLPWLIGTARNLLTQDRRALSRAQQLHDRVGLLEAVTRHDTEDVAETAFRREHALRALATLTEDQREALLLVAWDGLSIVEAAEVLELRPGALRARLHRGRAVLEAALVRHERPEGSGHPSIGRQKSGGRAMSTSNDWDRSTEESLTSGRLALLRSPAPVLDDEWMGRTLEAILADVAPGRPRARRWHRLVIGATVVVAATGGVAAATGTVPEFVEARMGWLQRHSPESSQPSAPTVSLIADVALPGDGRFAAWRGIGQGEMCSAQVDNWDGRERFAGGGMGCGEIDPESADRDRQLFDYRFSPDARGDWYHPVVFGAPDSRPQDASVTRSAFTLGSSTAPTGTGTPRWIRRRRGFGVVVPGRASEVVGGGRMGYASGETAPWDIDLRSVVIDLLDDQDRLVRSITLYSANPNAVSANP